MIFPYLETPLKENFLAQFYQHDDGCLKDLKRDTVAQKQVPSTVE